MLKFVFIKILFKRKPDRRFNWNKTTLYHFYCRMTTLNYPKTIPLDFINSPIMMHPIIAPTNITKRDIRYIQKLVFSISAIFSSFCMIAPL